MENQITDRFNEYKDCKILVYGTGKISARVIDGLKDFNIVGVADKEQMEGRFEGYNIVSIDILKPTDIDVVIVASLPRNYPVISERIIYKCFRSGWILLGADGTNLSESYNFERRRPLHNKFFRQNAAQLKSLIDRYDAVSFDLFDTLIMRKTLVCTDILELVDSRINAKGIHIEDFVNKRIDSERMANGGDIYTIYNILAESIGLSDEEKKYICSVEIGCEKDCIVPRYDMVEVMNYAVKMGKRVSIISDMYLTGEVLGDILEELNIRGYEKLYVSCDYGTGKNDSLFSIYLNSHVNEKCLHIGDNKIVDGECAGRFGIDSYIVKSAVDVMGMSNIGECLKSCKGINDRMLLGGLISEMFNSPFALNGTCGVVQVSDWNMFGKAVMAPLMIHYISGILTELESHDYDGVIFTARDCWIIKSVLEKLGYNGIYLYASRRLCLKAIIDKTDDLELFGTYVIDGDYKGLLIDFIGVDGKNLDDKDDNESLDEYYKRHGEIILANTHRTRENYKKYLEKIGFKEDGRYLFCDLIAQGTTQYALYKLGYGNIKGFYYALFHGNHNHDVPIKAVFDETDMKKCSIYYKDPFMEQLFTSFEPTVVDMDGNGKPIFGKEIRDADYLDIIRRIQEGAVEFTMEYFSKLYIGGESICNDIPEKLLAAVDYYEYIGECDKIFDLCVDGDERFRWVREEG
jgi:FMN phosphatase YigB (HAD superfamily)